MTALERHNWPGNIRELQNDVERGGIMTTGTVLSRHMTRDLTRGDVQPDRVSVVVEPVSIKTLADDELAH